MGAANSMAGATVSLLSLQSFYGPELWPQACHARRRPMPGPQDGKHGTAYGVLTWRGQQQRPEAPTKVAGPLKKVWRVVQDDSSAQRLQWQSLVADTLRQERRAAKAAAEEGAAAAAAAEQPAS